MGNVDRRRKGCAAVGGAGKQNIQISRAVVIPDDVNAVVRINGDARVEGKAR